MVKTVDMVETLFAGLALLGTLLTPLSTYYVWFVALAFLTQLFDVATSRETIDYVILLFEFIPLIAVFNLFAISTELLAIVWFIILAMQVYDDYEYGS
jgi:predicted membrane protein